MNDEKETIVDNKQDVLVDNNIEEIPEERKKALDIRDETPEQRKKRLTRARVLVHRRRCQLRKSIKIALRVEQNQAEPPEHRIDYTMRKTVVVIDKDHFALCKRLEIEAAPDTEFAQLLNIPVTKVRVFKHKMKVFEEKLRARRRAARLNCRRLRRKKKRLSAEKVGALRKQELSSEERFKCARDLILQDYTTHEISKVLKISIRSVSRFRKRLRDQKKQMQDEGELEVDEKEEGGEWDFKCLSSDLKGKKIAAYYEQGYAATEIAKMLKINERSVRRWRIRIDEMKKNPIKEEEWKFKDLQTDAKCEKIAELADQGLNSTEIARTLKIDEKSVRRWRQKIEEAKSGPNRGKKEPYKPHKRYVKCVDRATVENTKKLLEMGATNKEICIRLNIPMTLVMKIVQRIWSDTIEGIIDDTPEKIKETEMKKRSEKKEVEGKKSSAGVKKKVTAKRAAADSSSEEDDDWDPHMQFKDDDDDYWPSQVKTEHDDNDDLEDIDLNQSLPEENQEMQIQDPFDPLCDLQPAAAAASSPKTSTRVKREVTKTVPPIQVKVKEEIGEDSAKTQTGMKLLSMNVKTTDIMKMLNVSEKVVLKWKKKLGEQQKIDLVEIKDEPDDDYVE